MMRTKPNWKVISILLPAVIAVCLKASAEDWGYGRGYRGSGREMRTQPYQTNQWQRRGAAELTRQSRAGSPVSPQGWVRVATDYDNDGRYDAVETMCVADLEQAREKSQSRAQEGEPISAPSRRERTAAGDSGGMDSVEGKIENLRDLRLTGMEGDCLIAKIARRDGGTARVCLGPASELSELNLSEGDTVTVRGKRGHINERTMLIAKEVESGDKSVSVKMPSGRHLKRAEGKILQIRTVQFRGEDEAFAVAKIELKNGKAETVNFGPKSEISKLELQEGDSVNMLVRPGNINGKPGMIVEQIQTGDDVVRISQPKEKSYFKERESRTGQDEMDREKKSGKGNE